MRKVELRQPDVDSFLNGQIVHIYGSSRDDPFTVDRILDFSHFYHPSFKEADILITSCRGVL